MSIQFKKRERTTLIMLHSSHTPPSLPRAMGFIKWQGRKLGLLEIGYHLVIERDGHVIETRPRALIGQASVKHNAHAVHICLMGGVDEDYRPADNFTEEQRISLFDNIRLLRKQYGGIPIMGHSEVVKHHNVKCPEFDMADLRADYATYVATGGSLV